MFCFHKELWHVCSSLKRAFILTWTYSCEMSASVQVLPFPRPLGESIFDSNINLSGCAVSAWWGAGHWHPSDLYCLWKARGHSFSALYIGHPFLKGTFPPAHSEDLRGQQERSICNLLARLLEWWPEISLCKPFSLSVQTILSGPLIVSLEGHRKPQAATQGLGIQPLLSSEWTWRSHTGFLCLISSGVFCVSSCQYL